MRKRQFLLPLALLLSASMPATSSAVSASVAEWIEQPWKLTPNNASPAGTRFGQSVAISGTTSLVGAPEERGLGIERGAGHIYELQPSGQWQETATLVSSNPVHRENFGYSVALSGDAAVVGSHGEYATVFHRNQGAPGNWGEVANLTPSDESAKRFGWSVGASNDTAIVGTYGAQAAYIFDRNNGGPDSWGETAKLVPVGGHDPYRFGFTVGLSQDTAIVGAMYEQSKGAEAGAAYIYERDLGGDDHWGQAVRLVPSDLQPYDRFGQGVAVDGDTAVVGAWWGGDTGSVYVFDRNEGGLGQWGQVAKLVPDDSTSHFGFSVGISNDTIVVGATWDSDMGHQSGAAYFFGRDQVGVGQWGQIAKVTAADGHGGEFGGSAAVSGDLAIIGVPYDREYGYQAGAAYVYAVPEPSTIVLLAMGAFGLFAHGWRRRNT